MLFKLYKPSDEHCHQLRFYATVIIVMKYSLNCWIYFSLRQGAWCGRLWLSRSSTNHRLGDSIPPPAVEVSLGKTLMVSAFSSLPSECE